MNPMPAAPVNVHGRLIEAYYQSDQMVTAGPGRRLAGWFLDGLLGALTLGVGWVIWFLIVAGRGQTPGKQLLGMYIIVGDGTRAGWSYTILREVIVKGVFWLISVATLGLLTVLGALWCLWDRNHQCLWDKLGSTYVGVSRNGFRPSTRLELNPSAGRGAAPIVVGAAFVLFVVVSLGIAGGLVVATDSGDSPDPNGSLQASSDALPQIGELVRVGSLDLTVTAVETPFDSKQFNQFNEPNVAIHIMATNARGDPGEEYDFILNSFKAVDANGVAHPSSICAGCPGDFADKSLTRGGTLEGTVYFLVPEGTALKELLYEPLFSNNKARISLE